MTTTFTASYTNYGWNYADNILILNKDKTFGMIIPQPNNSILTYGDVNIEKYNYIGGGKYNIELKDSIALIDITAKMLNNKFAKVKIENHYDVIIDFISNKSYTILDEVYENINYEGCIKEHITINNFDFMDYLLNNPRVELVPNETISNKFDIGNANVLKLQINIAKDIDQFIAKKIANLFLEDKYLYIDSYELKNYIYVNINDYFKSKHHKFKVFKIDKHFFVTITNIFNSEYIGNKEEFRDIENLITNVPELIFIKNKEYFKDLIGEIILIGKNIHYILGHKLSYGCKIDGDNIYDMHKKHLPNVNRSFKSDIIKSINKGIRKKIENSTLDKITDELKYKTKDELIKLIESIENISINDSYKVGNCEIGTKTFLAQLGINENRSEISGVELAKAIKNTNINIKNNNFLRVLAYKTSLDR